jgi:hypothetical protein
MFAYNANQFARSFTHKSLSILTLQTRMQRIPLLPNNASSWSSKSATTDALNIDSRNLLLAQYGRNNPAEENCEHRVR